MATADETLEPESLSATLPSGGSPARARAPAREPGRVIDRYVVLDKLGAGAMGVVLAAYDPELDRKVALKLLSSLGPAPEAARARLQREAQALAKLDHRNVVRVHDVGVHEGELFVAMELVVGQTLRAWMSAGPSPGQPRPWREVVRVMAEAGRGLAAAHGAGFVHRDFKPDNVMIGDDGRVRVMDFGLARSQADEQADEPAAGPSPAPRATSQALTQTGALMGSPAYMAPELFDGQVADARSDQFGFCVTLHEALYGQRPFHGDNLVALIEAIHRAELAPPPASSKVPPWLRKLVLRGLARAPEQRFESMDALVDVLVSDPTLRRRRGIVAVGLVGLFGVGVWSLGASVRAPAACTGMDAALAGVWDDSRRAALRSAFAAVELGHADDTRAKVEAELDDYAQRWVAARVEACDKTQQGEQSGALLDLRMACLDERLSHLGALVEVLTDADETVVNKAARAAAGSPKLERCADVEALTAAIPPPDDPELAARVTALDQRLIAAQALEDAGKYADALALADAVVAELDGIDYAPLEARARLRQGILQDRSGDAETAAATLARAYDLALGQGMLEVAASASTRLLWVVGYALARPEDGRAWAVNADPLTRAVGRPEARARYLHSLASVALSAGQLDEARVHFEAAIETLEQALGPDDPAVAESLEGLAISVGQLGEYEQARAYLERTLSIFETALGPAHPDLANPLNNLGNMAGRQGKLDEARAYFERALAIQEATLGPTHRNVAAPLDNLGAVAQLEGDNEGARAYLERALAIREQTLGPAHPSVARTLDNLAAVAAAEQRHEDARALLERSLAITEAALGPEHPSLAYSLLGLGGALRELGDAAGAVPHLERALALRTTNEVDPLELALAQFGLAEALGETGQAARARELAARAQAIFADAGEAGASQLEIVDAWLAAHDG